MLAWSFGFVTLVDLITTAIIIHGSPHTSQTETEEAKLINDCENQEPAVSSFTAIVINAEHIFSSSAPPSCFRCSVWCWTELHKAEAGMENCFAPDVLGRERERERERERDDDDDDDALLIRNAQEVLAGWGRCWRQGAAIKVEYWECCHQQGTKPFICLCPCASSPAPPSPA